MAEKIGVDQLEDLAVGLSAFANAVVDSLEDNRISLGDLPRFIGIIPKMFSAIKGIGEVPAELADMTEEEKRQIIEAVQDELDLDEDVEAIVIRALSIGSDINKLVKAITKLKAKKIEGQT